MKNKQAEQKECKMKIVVDFGLVWAIMWRWVVLIFLIYFFAFALAFVIGGLISLIK